VRNEDRQTAFLVIALLAVGALAWWFWLRPPLQVDATALAALPEQIGVWRGEDVPLRPEEQAILRADFNLQRAYTHAFADPIWLYVGYYGTDRGGRTEHTPEVCYPANGWQILQKRALTVDPHRGLRANEYVAEFEGETELVLFWYRSRSRTGMLGWIGQALDRVTGRLFEGRADGALVRISTRFIGGDEIFARTRLIEFASELDPLLETHWPSEQPRG
jgi:EpsI family protein